VAGGELDDSAVLQVHDAQTLPLGSGGSIYESLAIGRERWKAVVVLPGSDLAEAGAVGLDDSDLGASVSNREERGKAENDGVAGWRPLRSHRALALTVVKHVRCIRTCFREHETSHCGANGCLGRNEALT